MFRAIRAISSSRPFSPTPTATCASSVRRYSDPSSACSRSTTTISKRWRNSPMIPNTASWAALAPAPIARGANGSTARRARREVSLAPIANDRDDRHEALPCLGQTVFDLGRNEAVILARDHSGFGQRLQLAAQHAGRDFPGSRRAAEQAGSDFTVAPGSILEVPQDADFVFAADHGLKRHHRAAVRPDRFRCRRRIDPLNAHRRFLRSARLFDAIIFVHTCGAASASASLAARPGERQSGRGGGPMKHFLIKYRFKDGSEAAWREQIGRFIAAVEADATLNGRISYRCMKADNGSGEYYHLAATADDEAGKALQSRDFFKAYTEETRRVSGGTVEVLPLAIVAETSARA